MDNIDEEGEFEEIKKNLYKNSKNPLILPSNLLITNSLKKAMIVDDNGVNRIAITDPLKMQGINTIDENDG